MSNREQVVLCIHWVTENFEVHEDFIRLYVVEAIDAKTLILVIKDVLLVKIEQLSRLLH